MGAGQASEKGQTPLGGLRVHVSVALPSTATGWPLPFEPEISMRRGLRSSGFGIRTSSTPWLKDASILSGSTPSGSVSERLKRPNERSIRYQPFSRCSCSAFRSPEM